MTENGSVFTLESSARAPGNPELDYNGVMRPVPDPTDLNPGRILKPLLRLGTAWVLLGLLTPALAVKAPEKPRREAADKLPRQWVLIHASPEFSVHLDEDSRRVTLDGLRVWKLWDYRIPKEADGRPFKSEKVQTEYDCKQHRIRELIWVTYAEPRGRGEVVGAEPLMQDWKTPDPQSISDLEWQYLCPSSPRESPAPPHSSHETAPKPRFSPKNQGNPVP